MSEALIPLKGASAEQLDTLRMRLGTLFPPKSDPVASGIELDPISTPPVAPEDLRMTLAERVTLVGEIVHFWTSTADGKLAPRAAVVVFANRDSSVDLWVFTSSGFSFALGAQFGRGHNRWTRRGA